MIVPSGTSVSWEVSADGYTTQSGTHTVTKTETKNVTLTAIVNGENKEIVFLEQDNLQIGYVAASGAPTAPTSSSHYYFEYPATGVKSITITVTAPGTNALYYVVHVADGYATKSYFNIQEDFTESSLTKTIDLPHDNGVLYFNVFDGQKATNSYGYARSATLQY